ncbi:DMT family transporter [Catenulispora sp. NF23]|uniref:DMT family transporter n=1 Tax=Catenulispora pinistramenti TaxID=2705254 RepID=UPI001BAA9E4E|nr:DMT family transporter [Catenulispora pinistramenti]MBS2531670.1 DMT family transporter [Catenulispora pinistramenti]
MSAAQGRLSQPTAKAVVLGTLGVTGFSLTLPVTRYADPAFGPELVGPGRALFAAVFAVTLLLVLRRPLFPPRRMLPSVLVVTGGTVIGYPLLVAHALESVSASHASVVLAFLPASTAVMAVLRASERPTRGFWVSCAAGTVLIVGYMTLQADSRFGVGDLELIGAVLAASAGYAEGGTLSRQVPGWVVTCWSLVCGVPGVAAIILIIGLPHHIALTWTTAAAFAYVALVSSLLAFVFWYKALAIGGIAKLGQVQLLQPILTMLFSALILGERLDITMMLIAVGVGVAVLSAQRTRVTRVKLDTESTQGTGNQVRRPPEGLCRRRRSASRRGLRRPDSEGDGGRG